MHKRCLSMDAFCLIFATGTKSAQFCLLNSHTTHAQFHFSHRITTHIFGVPCGLCSIHVFALLQQPTTFANLIWLTHQPQSYSFRPFLESFTDSADKKFVNVASNCSTVWTHLYYYFLRSFANFNFIHVWCDCWFGFIDIVLAISRTKYNLWKTTRA